MNADSAPVKCRACGWRGIESELVIDEHGDEHCPLCSQALIEDAEELK